VGEQQPVVARNLALLGLGSLLACAWGLVRATLAGGPVSPGPVALWVADRDGQQVVGLDRTLFPARSVELAWPTALAARRDGGVWATSSALGSPRDPHQLVRLDASGRVVMRATVGVPIELESVDRADALLIVEGFPQAASSRHAPSRNLLRVRDTGEVAVLLERVGLTAAAGRGARVVAGSADGRLALLTVTPTGVRVESEVHFAGAIGDLAPGYGRGTWWALVRASEPVLHFLGPDLTPVWTAPAGVGARGLIPVPGEERVWLASSTRPELRRLGPGGALELQRFDLPLTGLVGGLAWDGGGVLLSASGAVLHLDRHGRSAPGQGGFRFLTGLARAGGRGATSAVP